MHGLVQPLLQAQEGRQAVRHERVVIHDQRVSTGWGETGNFGVGETRHEEGLRIGCLPARGALRE